MPISILNNSVSLNAQRNIGQTQDYLSKNVKRLSSGERITSAADDSASLSVSEKLRSDIRSTSQASRNANDGISMTQIAEGALNESASILVRMRELAVQSSNGAVGSTERGFINQEFVALRSEIDRISQVTEFNGNKLLDGSIATGVGLQVGIRNNAAADRIVLSITAVNSTSIGINTTSLSTAANAQGALVTLDSAINNLSSNRSRIGSIQNRLINTISNLGVANENLTAANSRIRDADVAQETAALARNQILSQAGASMLSQANSISQVALALLR
jgi:flagellin